MSRATTAEGVLETIYDLAGVTPPVGRDDDVFRGHPLAVRAEGRGGGVLRHLAGARRGRRVSSFAGDRHEKQTAIADCDRRSGARRSRRSRAADLKVDLSKETVGRPPATFEPMVGTWVVAQDGADKVIMVDGRPWVASKDNPTKLLIESARKLYGTSNEELMDNAKQFAYFPVAVLRERRQLHERHDQREVQDHRRRRRSRVRHPLQRQAERRLARGPLQRHREQRRAVGVPQRHAPQHAASATARNKFMLDRAAWHELKLTVDGADLKTWLDGELALEYTLGSEPGPGRNNAPPNPDLIPANNPCCGRRSRARSACGRRPTRPATSRTTW